MKRIFISFAVEDSNLRDLLVGQSKNDSSPFEFADMSVKKPWDKEWKTNCRTKIKGCNGLIAILTDKTFKADGQIWEIKCALEEGIPVIGMWGHSRDKYCYLPLEAREIRKIDWSWSEIANWIKTL